MYLLCQISPSEFVMIVKWSQNVQVQSISEYQMLGGGGSVTIIIIIISLFYVFPPSLAHECS